MKTGAGSGLSVSLIALSQYIYYLGLENYNTLFGPTLAQNLTMLSSAIADKFKGCKIVKWIT